MTFLLDTPFVDVRGDTLRWTLEPVDRTPLARRDIDLDGDIRVSLRVLGASHQVVVEHRGERVLSETVACDLIDAAAMPGVWSARPGYTFTSTIERVDPEQFTDRVDELLRYLHADIDTLVAHFPGSPNAVTALEVKHEVGALNWQTWHAYPQTGELVRTTTAFNPTAHVDSLNNDPTDQHEEFADV